MTIFNKLHKFFIVIFLGMSFVVKAEYYTRELNLGNDFEVTQVAQLLFYKERKVRDFQTGVERPMSYEECQLELDRAKQEVRQNALNNKKIFICLSTKNSEIYGILCCEVGRRKLGMVEYTRSRVNKNNDWKFWKEDTFNIVMLSMTNYAETFYTALSMKSIAVHVISKDDASFYTKHGYRILNNEEADELYYTAVDQMMFVLGLPFIIAFFPFYMVYKACDWGIFYKQL